jgi:hypothetical protein
MMKIMTSIVSKESADKISAAILMPCIRSGHVNQSSPPENAGRLVLGLGRLHFLYPSVSDFSF